jgi:hypothetical protein
MSAEQVSAEERAKHLADLLKRATFLLGTLCLAHEVFPENVGRLLDEASAALKREKQ